MAPNIDRNIHGRSRCCHESDVVVSKCAFREAFNLELRGCVDCSAPVTAVAYMVDHFSVLDFSSQQNKY